MMTMIADVMIDVLMTLIFLYSICKIRRDYPIITVTLTICYLCALMTSLYNKYSV